MNSTFKSVKIKIQLLWDENPLIVIGAATGAVYATAKLLEGFAAVNNSRAWKKEVDRRARKIR
jgi:hypothetical protein